MQILSRHCWDTWNTLKPLPKLGFGCPQGSPNPFAYNIVQMHNQSSSSLQILPRGVWEGISWWSAGQIQPMNMILNKHWWKVIPQCSQRNQLKDITYLMVLHPNNYIVISKWKVNLCGLNHHDYSTGHLLCFCTLWLGSWNSFLGDWIVQQRSLAANHSWFHQ